MEDPFRSARLVYRSFETEDEKFIQLLQLDAVAMINSGARITPGSKKDATELVAHLMDKEKSALAVVICLPVHDETGDKDEKEKGDGKKENKEGEGKPKENGARKEKLIDIGIISLTRPRGPGAQYSRHGEIAINLVDEYRGQGYGTEAIKWITNWGFMYAGLHRIAITCISYNEGARKLYDRMGWVYEGTRRESIWMNGGFHGLIDFSLLDREHKTLKEQRKW